MNAILKAEWERPVNAALYIMGVDSATGTGRDYAVIQVLRIYSADKIEQVATYFGFFCHGWYGRLNKAAYQAEKQ